MVGANAQPEPAPVTRDGVLILTEHLPVDDERDQALLDPRDYRTAHEVYAQSAERARSAALDEHPIALNAAVDAIVPMAAEAALQRLYRRLIALAEHVHTVPTDAFEAGLRVAAVQARAVARELAGGAR